MRCDDLFGFNFNKRNFSLPMLSGSAVKDKGNHFQIRKLLGLYRDGIICNFLFMFVNIN